jgi:hypothetical protein
MTSVEFKPWLGLQRQRKVTRTSSPALIGCALFSAALCRLGAGSARTLSF